MAKPKHHKPTKASAASTTTRTHGLAATAALVVLAAALVAAQLRGSHSRFSGSVEVAVEPNGGGDPWALRLDGSWQSVLHARYPEARRIGLWNRHGVEVMWSGVDGQHGSSGAAAPEAPAGITMYAVLDDFPWVWPSSPEIRTVDVGDAHVRLETLSVAPRVLLAHGVLSEEECDTVRSTATPSMEQSTTLVGGKTTVTQAGAPRTSSTAWLKVADTEEPGRAVLERVQRRVAMLARLHVGSAESMQVLRYQPGEHYHYHTDTGGSPSIAGRALTALFYLNHNFSGGETNFPMARRAQPMNNVYRVREEFHNCQVESGLTVQPKQGSVLLFYNLAPNSATKDFFTWHGSCDVTAGEKWAANLWFHLSLMSAVRKRFGTRAHQFPERTSARSESGV